MNTRHCPKNKAELAARVQGQLRTLERQAAQLKKQAKRLLMSMTVAEIGEYAKRIKLVAGNGSVHRTDTAFRNLAGSFVHSANH